jgi:hypothetical protein
MVNAKKNTWSIPSNLSEQDLTIVACTNHYFGDDYIKPYELPSEWGISISCNFTTDLSLASKADALWFHAPTTRRVPKHKRPDQPWILMSMESDENYPLQKNQQFLDLFDIHMTYRLDSDVPTPYPNWKQYGDFMNPPLSTQEKGSHSALAAYIASNPVQHRDDYARQMFDYIPVDSLGKCLNNKTLPDFVTGDNIWAKGGFQAILDILPKYKFYLAFENSIATDYVTERVFHALVAGTVPIYYGADNIKEFLPADNAVINVADFDSPKELSEYLLYLDQNDEAYEQHLAWKREGYSDSFKKLLDIGDIEPLHRLAIKLAHKCSRDCNCGGRIRQP